jgi:large subunit ribosomal protein L14
MSIQKETNLIIADNSGAKAMRVIHVVGSTGKTTATVGEIVICAIKEAIPGGIVKKKAVVHAVVVRTAKAVRREDGSYIRFGENAAVIIKGKKDLEPVATRVFGPIAREVRQKGFTKIASLAPEVL